MIDIRILRESPEKVKENCRRRGTEVDVDALYEKDQERLKLTKEVEELRAERNTLSKKSKEDPEAREKVKSLKNDIKEKEQTLQELNEEVNSLMAWLPNFLADDVPDGDSDDYNVPLRQWGDIQEFSFQPLSHDQLGEKLGLIDTTRGAKVAKSGFYFWTGRGAQLAAALFFWGQQVLIQKGFQLFLSPCVAKETTLYGTGYLPFLEDETFPLENEDLSLIGTSEQTLIAYHKDETLEGGELPLCYAAYTPCFRTEAGSYGKETKGIFRVHQFHKVEQIVFCTPETSEKWHQRCQEIEEEMLQMLGVPYHVVDICVGDLGAPGYKKYDIEAWFPGYGGFREVTSNTNLTDFQARRLNIKYKTDSNQKEFANTISATAVTDRLACAILENFQTSDGRVIIPEALRPYTGFSEIAPEQ